MIYLPAATAGSLASTLYTQRQRHTDEPPTTPSICIGIRTLQLLRETRDARDPLYFVADKNYLLKYNCNNIVRPWYIHTYLYMGVPLPTSSLYVYSSLMPPTQPTDTDWPSSAPRCYTHTGVTINMFVFTLCYPRVFIYSFLPFYLLRWNRMWMRFFAARRLTFTISWPTYCSRCCWCWCWCSQWPRVCQLLHINSFTPLPVYL